MDRDSPAMTEPLIYYTGECARREWTSCKSQARTHWGREYYKIPASHRWHDLLTGFMMAVNYCQTLEFLAINFAINILIHLLFLIFNEVHVKVKTEKNVKSNSRMPRNYLFICKKTYFAAGIKLVTLNYLFSFLLVKWH